MATGFGNKEEKDRAGDGSNHVDVKDMTITRQEFYRCLKMALRGISAARQGDRVTALVAGGEVVLQLAPLPVRSLGPTLRLERWQLTLEFDERSIRERGWFLKKFDQAFQRGGG